MLERAAITAPLVRMLCVALAVWLGMRLFAPATPVRDASTVMETADGCRDATVDEGGPRTSIRTRTPGLHRRYLMRDVVAPRAMRQLQQ